MANGIPPYEWQFDDDVDDFDITAIEDEPLLDFDVTSIEDEPLLEFESMFNSIGDQSCGDYTEVLAPTVIMGISTLRQMGILDDTPNGVHLSAVRDPLPVSLGVVPGAPPVGLGRQRFREPRGGARGVAADVGEYVAAEIAEGVAGGDDLAAFIQRTDARMEWVMDSIRRIAQTTRTELAPLPP